MNYKIIADEAKLDEFIAWLPDCLSNEQYYICLFARKKYFPEGFLTNDKCQLKRVTSKKENIKEKLRQMECEVGSYTFRGQPIPQEALCVYITPNPRDLTRAGLELLKGIAQKVADNNPYNPRSLAMDCIQVTSTRKIYFDTDIDCNNPSDLDNVERQIIIQSIKSNINIDCCTFIRTRGGMHCLIKKEDIDQKFKNSWYQTISQLGNSNWSITMNKDNLLPLVGTFQGGFIPSFIGGHYEEAPSINENERV